MTRKDVFVDLHKDSMRVKFLSRMPELDLRVIHLVRDVRGAVASFMKNASYDVVRATRRWLIDNMNSERALRFVPSDRWIRIRYDSLCQDPQGAVDGIADFVGVHRAAVPRDIFEAPHHIIGNRMRLKGDRDGQVRVDEFWRRKLSDGDLAIIARVAGAANRSFGHAWPPADAPTAPA
jgi:hypothetical protein